MRQVRLLPVVICAAGALLALKGFGLVTQGGYVLTGISSASAQSEPELAITDPTVALPTAPTLEDASPTLADTAPTLAGIEPALPEAGPERVLPGLACTDAAEGMAATHMAGCGPDGDRLTPELPVAASDNERALLERLGERRGDLEAREEELAMRTALIEAAEQRLDERTAALEALEARLGQMVEERDSAEAETFLALVGMYEQMKPRDAAGIFDALDGRVLLRVARAMNPRKMAPIMAEMAPARAQELTVLLVAGEAPTAAAPVDPMAGLPQIEGR